MIKVLVALTLALALYGQGQLASASKVPSIHGTPVLIGTPSIQGSRTGTGPSHTHIKRVPGLHRKESKDPRKGLTW